LAGEPIKSSQANAGGGRKEKWVLFWLRSFLFAASQHWPTDFLGVLRAACAVEFLKIMDVGITAFDYLERQGIF